MPKKNLTIDQSPSILLPPPALAKGIPVRSNQLYLKPGLLESRVAESPDAFSRLGEGFKKLFVDTTTQSSQAAMVFGIKSNLTNGSPKPIVIPIAGYTGHKKGENAENLFGRCFRDVAIKSKIIERGGLQRMRNPYVIQRGKFTRNEEGMGSPAPENSGTIGDRPPMPGRYSDIRVFKGGNRSFGGATPTI